MGLLQLLQRVMGRTEEPVEPSEDRPESARRDGAVAAPERPRREVPPVRLAEGAWWETGNDQPARPLGGEPTARTIDSRLYDHLAAALDDPNIELPSLPQVAQQALVKLRDETCELREAAEITGHDPALTAAILRLVNSVAYRGMREISRLDQAFARLGQRTVRSVLLAAVVKELTIRVGGPGRSLGEELWRCAFASGLIAERLARPCRLQEDTAFLVGLLHDIGKLAILKVVHDHQALQRAKISRALFDEVAARWHEHIGLRLAEAWNLPDPLPEIIGNHHREPTEDDPLKMHRLLVGFTDVCCGRLGYGPPVGGNFFELGCIRRIGLRDDHPSRELLLELPTLLADRMNLV